jgi:hypothetical protein
MNRVQLKGRHTDNLYAVIPTAVPMIAALMAVEMIVSPMRRRFDGGGPIPEALIYEIDMVEGKERFRDRFEWLSVSTARK